MKTFTCISLVMLVLMVTAALWAGDPVTPSSSSARSEVESNRRELWRANIQTPKDEGDSRELQEAIARLQKTMYPAKPAPVPVVTRVKPSVTPKITTIPAPTTQPKTPTTMPATTQPATMGIDVKDRIRKLNGIKDPAALADALFQAKHSDLAVVFYDRAIKGSTAAKTKAWSLFQAGNCNRMTKPEAALKAYDTLVASHPGSLWSEIALVQKGIITWRNADNMAAVFADIEKQNQQSSSLPERK
jgi:hypothetical protein